MQIRTILYQYIKTLIKHVFLLNFTYELLMILEVDLEFYVRTRACEKRESGKQPLDKGLAKWSVKRLCSGQ